MKGLLIVPLWIMILIYLWVLCEWGLGHLPTSVDIVQSSSSSLHAEKIDKSKCPIIKLITKAKQEPIFEEEEEVGPREVFVFALHCHFDEGQGSTYIIVYCLTRDDLPPFVKVTPYNWKCLEIGCRVFSQI